MVDHSRREDHHHPPALDVRVDAADLRLLEELSVSLAVEAGELVTNRRPEHLQASGTKTSSTDVVTAMDTASEDLLRARLGQLRPGDGILGEEGRYRPSETGITWVLDPIDGTVNYLYDLPAYAVSVAAVVGDPERDGQWTPIAGAVAVPGLGTVYRAHRGGGARRSALDGSSPRALRVSEIADPAQALLATGFGYLPDRRRRQGEMVTRLLPQIRDIRRIGSAALDLCLVASGRVDAYMEIGVHQWDMAAGWLVVTEAGGVVRGPQGAPAPTERLILACGGPLYPALARLVEPPGVPLPW